MDITAIIVTVFNSVISLFLTINLFLTNIVKLSQKLAKNQDIKTKDK